MYVVTSDDYTDTAREAIVNSTINGPLEGQFKEYFRFLKGEDILEQLQKIDFGYPPFSEVM